MKIDLSELPFDDEPLDEKFVDQLVERIRTGRPITMPLLYKEPNGYLCVVDGRHRIAAAVRCGATTIDAYIIDGVSGPEKLRELRTELNQHRLKK